MVGKRQEQQNLFDVGNVWDIHLDPKSFHGQLARVSDRLFSDEDFAELYSERHGRPSVPPSLLALVVLMQCYEQLSDQAAIDHTSYDLRWAAVLRREAGAPLCAKSTLQLFRSHIVLHKKFMLLIQKSLEEARRSGLLRDAKLVAAIDTKPIMGRGAVEDTYNLLATGMKQLARALARGRGVSLTAFLQEQNLCYLHTGSVKGHADIDWSDAAARDALLTEQVANAKRLIFMIDREDDAQFDAAELLATLLMQDVSEKRDDDGKRIASVKQGTPPGRIPSWTDPEQRHGRKSKSKKFVGAKSSVIVDTDSGLILATEVLPGDCGDATGVLALVECAEENAGQEVEKTLGDCAYGSGALRQEFEDAGRELVAKAAAPASNGQLFPKSAFRIDLPVIGTSLVEAQVFCPAGKEAMEYSGTGQGGVTFHFDEHCRVCALRTQCTRAKYGRQLQLHPQERLIQEARLFQATAEGRATLRKRVTVENGLARMARFGIGQARYIGHAKTRFQLSVAATVVNLRRSWNWMAREMAAKAPRITTVEG